jgi:hypothetical protein
MHLLVDAPEIPSVSKNYPAALTSLLVYQVRQRAPKIQSDQEVAIYSASEYHQP